MNRQAELYCRDILRDARAMAFRDSEAFAEILFAVERLGSLQTGKHGTLRDYKEALVALARRSPLAEDLPARRSDLHVAFPRLYSIVQTARNDALHQGAAARHLTDHCVELALVLEDALVSESTILADYMVKAPLCAFSWQPLSFVRQQMLANSFSFLPIRGSDGRWRLLADLTVARVLRAAQTGEERNRRLATTVEDAERLFGLGLEVARTAAPGTVVNDVLEGPDASPVLVIGESGELLGIVTSFDLL